MFKISIDTGGTFSDCIAIDENGKEYRRKVLSKSVLRGEIISVEATNLIKIKANWNVENSDLFFGYEFKLLGIEHDTILVIKHISSYGYLHLFGEFPEEIDLKGHTFEITAHEEAPILAARLITETPLDVPFPPIEMKLGSTKGTNALLERKGARVLFLVTKGFKDLLLIGNQARPDIFALNIVKPKPFFDIVIEVDEQVDAKGNILQSIDSQKVLDEVLLQNGSFDSIAICLKNAYKNPVHEKKLANVLNQFYDFVSTSTEISSQIKFLNRAETTVINAYLSPVIDTYLGNIQKCLGDGSLKVLSSAGHLVDSHHFFPKDSLLSGPAGGIVGAVEVANACGINKIITFDMGGTSTDVARYSGNFDYSFEIEIAGAQVISPCLTIETVAAGGGSLCYFDGQKLCVGPESAGSSPGPACYGEGGGLTITDVNLLLGRLETSQFSIPIKIKAAELELERLLIEINKNSNKAVNKYQILEGFLQIANEKMAEAAKKISVVKGYNPAEYTLLAFGGAGGMHACGVATHLGITSILLPADAGLLSAYGISKSLIEAFYEQLVLETFNETSFENSKVLFKKSSENAIKAVQKDSVANENIFVKQQLIYLRFVGQDASLEVNFKENSSYGTIVQEFKDKYLAIYAHWPSNRNIEIETIRVIASEIKENLVKQKADHNPKYYPEPSHYISTYIDGGLKEIPVFIRQNLKVGAIINGFALLVDPFSAAVIENGWSFELDANFTGKITYSNTHSVNLDLPQEAELELFTNRFIGIAKQMGVMLQRTAISVNVKERLDFSCALLDEKAELIANAPHIPVHLGSLGVCVRTVLNFIAINKGDVIITNHPKYGGSHLPDVTLIAGVFTESNQLIGYVVNRCHHAEIGGIRPASMPPNATCLLEEGVPIHPTYLVKAGVSNFDAIEKLLTKAKFPTRNVQENIADLNAALAAIVNGQEALKALADTYSLEKVHLFMERLKNYSATIVHNKLISLPKEMYKAEEYLDDGSVLKVEMKICKSIENKGITFDFTGTSIVHSGNLNANPAIVNSVVMYVLRLLVEKNIPLNDGILRPIQLIIPENTMLNPVFPNDDALAPAVVGGNVETSQRLTDTLLKAFEIAACSQGTMNNTLFGNETFGYYETICGGSGASFGHNGTSAVHTHMTNTRITDAEIMELRYPVRLNKFEIRENSGGKGKYLGGNGILREIEFLAPVKLSFLSQHRIVPPYGLKGGENGANGKQWIIHVNQEIEILKGTDGANLEIGDVFHIETPGGGGWGECEV
jgi:5-oxoprolinase (ATP-hydrolysing)